MKTISTAFKGTFGVLLAFAFIAICITLACVTPLILAGVLDKVVTPVP